MSRLAVSLMRVSRNLCAAGSKRARSAGGMCCCRRRLATKPCSTALPVPPCRWAATAWRWRCSGAPTPSQTPSSALSTQSRWALWGVALTGCLVEPGMPAPVVVLHHCLGWHEEEPCASREVRLVRL